MRTHASLTRRRALTMAALGLPAASANVLGQVQPAPPSDAVGAILADCIDAGRFSLGYVAGLADAGGQRIVVAGQSGTPGRTLDGTSVFEIGSITKVFTALLLADMVGRGEVAFSDPAARYLPAEARPQSFDGRPFSLLDLATHTSGLARMPSNITSADPANPYADYTVAQLYQALATTPPGHYPGSHYEYSNLGMALLGHVLALRAGRSYEDLVVSRICDPLGLDDTRITLTPGMAERLVQGHDAAFKPVANWDLPAVAGAGALRSTAADLLRFVTVCQGRAGTPLDGAFATLLDVRRQAGRVDVVAAGWFVRNRYGDEIVWKDGDTGGYSGFIGYSTRSGTAAVLLANTASGATIPEIGRHLINPAFPLPSLHRQVAIDPGRLTALAGRYAVTADFVLTVTPGEGRLLVQATGQPRFEAFPSSDTTFFYRAFDAQLSFDVDATGAASAVVIHQNGRDLRATRVP